MVEIINKMLEGLAGFYSFAGNCGYTQNYSATVGLYCIYINVIKSKESRKLFLVKQAFSQILCFYTHKTWM